MRTILILASAALVSAASGTGSALADDHLNLTPPLYREQARISRQVRPASDITTVPQPVLAAPAQRRTVSAADRPVFQASAAASR